MTGRELPALPYGWAWASLESCCQKVTDGSHNSPKHVVEGYPFITIADVEHEQIGFGSAKLIGKEDFEKLRSNCNPHEGDVLFSKDGSVGKTVEIDFERDFIVLSSLAILRPYREVLIPRYLKYVLKSSLAFDQYDKMKTGTALTRVIVRNLKKVKIPIAPVNEQRRIVAKVEALFAENNTAREAIDKIPDLLRRFRRSVLVKAFKGELTQRDSNDEPAQRLLERTREQRKEGKQISLTESNEEPSADLPELPKTWVWTVLGKIAEIKMGQSPHGSSYNRQGRGVLLLNGPTEFGREHPMPVQWTTEPTKICDKGDLLICVRGNTTGRMNWADRAYCIGRGLAAISTNPNLIEIRLLFYYLSKEIREIMRLTTGSTFPNLQSDQLRKLPFPLAPHQEQKRLAFKIDECFSFADNIETSVERAKGQTDKIDHAILATAFGGELVPQDPNDEPANVLLERIRAARASLLLNSGS